MEKSKVKRTRASRSQKSWRFNFLDVVILLVILLFVASMVILYIPRVTDLLGSDGNKNIVYTVVFHGVDVNSEISDQQRVVDKKSEQVLGMVDGSPETEDCYESVRTEVTDESGKTSTVLRCEKVDGKIDLIVTITATATYADGKGYEINGNRIAVGREYEMVFPGFTATGTCIAVSEENAQ